MGRHHQGMDRPGVRQVSEGSGEQGKMEKTGCKIICGALMTLSVKGLMMMMMMIKIKEKRSKKRGGPCWGVHLQYMEIPTKTIQNQISGLKKNKWSRSRPGWSFISAPVPL